MGIGKSYEEVNSKLQTFPKVAVVAPPTDYITSQGLKIKKQDISLQSRIISMGKLHHTYTATGLLSLASCAAVPNSIPNQMLEKQPE